MKKIFIFLALILLFSSVSNATYYYKTSDGGLRISSDIQKDKNLTAITEIEFKQLILVKDNLIKQNKETKATARKLTLQKLSSATGIPLQELEDNL